MKFERPSSLLAAALVDRARAPVEGALEDLSTESLVLGFPRPEAPVRELGQVQSVRFRETRAPREFAVDARIVGRSEHEESRSYHLEFVDPKEFWGGLTPQLRAQLNRRGAFRVQPVSRQPIPVTLAGDGAEPRRRFKGTLHDISVSGLAVRVRGERESALTTIDAVRCAFPLPTCPDEIVLWGSIRRRRLDGENRIYGITYDAERTERFAEVESRIGYYVVERQREWLVRG